MSQEDRQASLSETPASKHGDDALHALAKGVDFIKQFAGSESEFSAVVDHKSELKMAIHVYAWDISVLGKTFHYRAVFYKPEWGIMHNAYTYAAKTDTAPNCDDGRNDWYEQNMFVSYVELMEPPKRRIPVLVRLDPIEYTKGTCACTSEPFGSYAFEATSRLADRKAYIVCNGGYELICQKVESGSEIVGNVADDSAQFRWNRMDYMKARNAIASLRVILNPNAAWVEFPVGVHSSFHLFGVALCPLDFDPWTEKGAVWHKLISYRAQER